MANAIAIDGTHQRTERYANAIVELMRPQLKVRNLFSKQYEGSPKAGAVKVPVRDTDPTVSNYDVKDGIALSQSATSYQTIAIDKNVAINELIDGYEAVAVPDNLLAQRLEAGAYQMAKTMEEDALKVLTTAGNYTASETEGTTSTANTIYEDILKDIAKVAKLGVSKDKIKVVVSYETELLLLTNSLYANSASQIGAELAREGIVGRVNGCDVITEDIPAEYIVFGTDWANAIDEFVINPQVVDLSDANYVGASALKGRAVFANAITNKNAVVVKGSTTSA